MTSVGDPNVIGLTWSICLPVQMLQPDLGPTGLKMQFGAASLHAAVLHICQAYLAMSSSTFSLLQAVKAVVSQQYMLQQLHSTLYSRLYILCRTHFCILDMHIMSP